MSKSIFVMFPIKKKALITTGMCVKSSFVYPSDKCEVNIHLIILVANFDYDAILKIAHIN